MVRGEGATITGTNGAAFLAYGTIPDWKLGVMLMDKQGRKVCSYAGWVVMRDSLHRGRPLMGTRSLALLSASIQMQPTQAMGLLSVRQYTSATLFNQLDIPLNTCMNQVEGAVKLTARVCLTLAKRAAIDATFNETTMDARGNNQDGRVPHPGCAASTHDLCASHKKYYNLFMKSRGACVR